METQRILVTDLEMKLDRETEALRHAVRRAARARRGTFEAQRDEIQRLLLAAALKDPSLAGHSLRTSRASTAVARALHLPPGEVEVVRYATRLHDLGKIGVPDSILFKNGRLTPEERLVVESHTRIGAQLLDGSSSKLLQGAQVVALTHHERWDGGGYPQGLAGEAIPLWGRICAVADTFDALTSERSYKPALSPGEACSILRRSRGSHLDPDLCDLFLAILPEILRRTACLRPRAYPL